MANHTTSLANDLDRAPDEKSAAMLPEMEADNSVALSDLYFEESRLKSIAAEQEQEALKLEQSGDDEANHLAGQMHHQAEIAQSLAKDVGQTISEMKSDPSKKLKRRRETLLLTAGVVIGVSDQEVGTASSMHGATMEHKQEMLVEKHEADAMAAPKKTVMQQVSHLLKPKHTAIAHAPIAPASTTHAMPHETIAHKATRHIASVWHATKEHVIAPAMHFIRETGTAIGGFAVTAWHKAGDVCSGTLHALAHPITTLSNMGHSIAHGAASLMHSAAAMFGFSEEEEVVVAKTPVMHHAPIARPLTMSAMLAGHTLKLHGIGQATTPDESESFFPLGLPMLKPQAQLGVC